MMIDRELAEYIKISVLSCVHQLDMSVKEAIEGGSDEHASMYRRLVGQVLGQLFTAVLAPIYDAHPDLEPEEIRKARQQANPSAMARETGNKLMKASTSAASELERLRASLIQMEGRDTTPLDEGLREAIDSLRIAQEFLRHVCPGLDAAR